MENSNKTTRILSILFMALASALVFVGFILAISTLLVHTDPLTSKVVIVWDNAGAYLAFMMAAAVLIGVKFGLSTVPLFMKNKDTWTIVKFAMEIISVVFLIMSCFGLAMHTSKVETQWAYSEQTGCIIFASLSLIAVVFNAAIAVKDNK